MVWLGIGCWSLVVVNLQALLHFTPDTSKEALNMVYVTNAFVYFCSGAQNLNEFMKILRGDFAGTSLEWRRPYPLLATSIFGAAGAGFGLNVGAADYGMSQITIIVLCVWQWLSLAVVIVDFCYFLCYEHEWGMSLANDPFYPSKAVNESRPLLCDRGAHKDKNSGCCGGTARKARADV